MADLNVFQMTNMELRKTDKVSKPVSKKPAQKKPVKESVRRMRKVARKPFDISANKIRFESLKRFLEGDIEDTELDVTADYTPEDDVVLVIDPDMDEVPEDTDEAIEEAEDLVGQHVCKCAICGANYVTDAEINEEVEIEDQECPVCGETGDQIVVGVITPTEELSDEDAEDIDNVEVEETEETEDDGEKEFEEEEVDDDFEESVKRSRMRTMRRRAESVRRAPAKRNVGVVQRKKAVSESKDTDYCFDEVTFNRMLTRFAKENYSNIKSVRIAKGTVRGNKMTLEGLVTTTLGSKRTIKFVCENFKPSKRMSIKFKEIGPFTESVKNEGATFVVECVLKGTKIIPAALRYSFKAKNAGIKESKGLYSVTGKILSEDARKRR